MNRAMLREVLGSAQVLLGEDWDLAGSGRSPILVRRPVGWWVQFIYHETGAGGNLVSYGGLLAKPLPASEAGDAGVSVGDAFRKARVDLRGSLSPESVAKLAVLSDELVFLREGDLHQGLEYSELRRSIWIEKGKDHRIYRGSSRHLLVMRRVLMGSRSRDDLIGDVRWVLEEGDRGLDNYGLRIPGVTNREFFGGLLANLETADRAGLNDLLLSTRKHSLEGLGIPEEMIADVDVPEPLVAW
ncbi:hypothetical protein SAMN04488550_4482 [Gordonia malaquae]|uniref:hypothetical protein n=1 Tax=Gordonia malaquae TaxID=410332 RepID=UPI0008997FA0|nr:hypothetical protein [Gordonia malaquae]SEE40494.1 hypothetical protein SAMN04488550_4482 [Gordonia malaquae]